MKTSKARIISALLTRVLSAQKLKEDCLQEDFGCFAKIF